MAEETEKKRKKWPIVLGIVLGITVGVPVLFIGGCSIYAFIHANDPAVPSEYWKANVESAKGIIEKKYSALGEYESEELLVDSTTESGKHFMAYYLIERKTDDKSIDAICKELERIPKEDIIDFVRAELKKL